MVPTLRFVMGAMLTECLWGSVCHLSSETAISITPPSIPVFDQSFSIKDASSFAKPFLFPQSNCLDSYTGLYKINILIFCLIQIFRNDGPKVNPENNLQITL